MAKIKKIGIGIGLILFIFTVYQLTASKEIGWIDSGVITAAAKTLGIPNPPGFPAYLLIAHIFTLIPWVTTVFNLKLLSQLSAIGISAAVFWLVYYLSPPKRKVISAIIASLSLAFSYNLWSQANNIETYTFTNLILLIFFIWLVKNKDNFKPWHLILLGFFGGLSLGLNPMIACIGPAVLWWSYKNIKNLLKTPLFLILAVVAGVIGVIAIYSYLPLRASTHPFLNWGDPVNWERIKTHLVGGGLNIYEPETNSINGFTGQPKIFLESFLHYLYLAIFQFTPLLFPFVVWGGWKLWQKDKTAFGLLTAVILGNLIFVVLYYGGNQESWTITSWVMMAVFLGLGISYLPDRFFNWWLLSIVLIPLVFWFPILYHSTDSYASDYAKSLYREVPENSIIIGGGDFFNSLTAYTREVTGERKDIIPVTGNMFYIFDWYRENLRLNTNLIISQKVEDIIKYKGVDEFTNAIDQLIADNPDRDFFITPLLLRDSVVAGTNEGNYHTSKYNLVPHGLLLKIIDKKSAFKPNEKLTEFPSFGKSPFYLERNYKNAYKLLRNDYAVGYAQFGDYFSRQNDLQKAEQFFLKAINQGTPDTPEFIQRIAIFYAQIGKNDLAKKYFEDSLARDPENPAIKQNIQTFLQQNNVSQTPTETVQSASSSGQLNFKSKSGLTFEYPKGWKVEEKESQIFVSDIASNFSLQIKKSTRPANITIEEYLNKQPSPNGQILEQGLAKIPNTDLAYVRLIKMGDKANLEFFLFKSDVVIRILVGPSDSPQMKVFDSIVSSIKL